MGAGSWDPDKWKDYQTTRQARGSGYTKTFQQTTVHKNLDVKGITLRESRDVQGKDPSNAIILAFDVTGSMGGIADYMARQGLGVLVQSIYDRKPVTDPQIMIMGIGDIYYDEHPLQATQFEADTVPMNDQLEQIYVEGGGGGQGTESYIGAWLVASLFTSIDCWEKRKKKGYLFTIGDEAPEQVLQKANLDRFLKAPIEKDLTDKELLEMVSRTYEVFHLIVEEGGCGRSHLTSSRWKELLGERAIKLSDHTKLAELVVSLIQMNEGATKQQVVDSWSGDTSLVVADAIKDVTLTRGEIAPGVSTL